MQLITNNDVNLECSNNLVESRRNKIYNTLREVQFNLL